MAREIARPAIVEFESPFPVTEGGKYELVCWGDSLMLRPRDYVNAIQPGMFINHVEYVVSMDLVNVDGTWVKGDNWRYLQMHRRGFYGSGAEATRAARDKASFLLINLINVYCKAHPEFVAAGHRARISEKVRHAEVEVERASKAFDEANAAYHKAIETENMLKVLLGR